MPPKLKLYLSDYGVNQDYFFPSNAFLRRRRKKALLRVNDRGGGWSLCILALCRACVFTCFVRACVLLHQINHARAIACTYVRTIFVQYVYSVHRASRRRTMHISN